MAEKKSAVAVRDEADEMIRSDVSDRSDVSERVEEPAVNGQKSGGAAGNCPLSGRVYDEARDEARDGTSDGTHKNTPGKRVRKTSRGTAAAVGGVPDAGSGGGSGAGAEICSDAVSGVGPGAGSAVYSSADPEVGSGAGVEICSDAVSGVGPGAGRGTGGGVPGTEEALLRRACTVLLEKLILGLDRSDPDTLVGDRNGLKSIAACLQDLREVLDIRSPIDLREQDARIAHLLNGDSRGGEIRVIVEGGEDMVC